MIQQLYRHLLLPAYESGLKRRPVFRYWAELERTQWLSRAQLEKIQFQALQRLIVHAFANCPHYRQTWTDLGLHPRQLQAPEDFHQWPVIDRSTIAERRLAMRSAAAGTQLLSKVSSGSTGTPLQIDYTPESYSRRMAAWHRGYAWANAGPGTRQFYLWGTPSARPSTFGRIKNFAYNRLLYRRQVASSFQVGDDQIPRLVERLNRYRPDVIVGYTNALATFARGLEEQGLRPHSPRSIVAAAEKLFPFQRALLERVFGAPVFETYGAREVMLMGAECDRHEGLHLTMENLLIEVLDDDGQPTPPGEEGNVVVTDLYNHGMPLVRYVNGDRAIAGWRSCSCGRGLPLLTQVVGRRTDMIRTPDGRQISGVFFPCVVNDFPSIRQFQIVQHSPEHVQMRIVVPPTWTAAEEARLRTVITDSIGSAVHFELVRTEQIPLTAGGKRQVVVSHCHAPSHEATVGVS